MDARNARNTKGAKNRRCVALVVMATAMGCSSNPKASNANGGAANGSGGTAGGTATGGNGGRPGSGGSSGATATGGAGGTPAGDQGIAAKYPGDVGIQNDPSVIFFDDFESYTQPSELNNRWDAVYQNQYVTLTTTAANVYAGNQAVEFTLPQQDAELSDACDKLVSPELDVLYLRYYSKFQSPFDVVGSSHNGSSISAHYFVNGQATPGVPADGTNKFLVAYEDWRADTTVASPGLLNFYIYYPGQRSQWGDHFYPTGLVDPNTSIIHDFGPGFVPYPDIIPELDRWYCWEYMVRANTPGQSDGRLTAWLDGNVVMDFPNLVLRTVPTLTIDRFGISFHIHNNPNGEQKKWFDNVVAAKSYIGPMKAP